MVESRLLVVGSINLDLCVRVPHLPRRGETVAGSNLERGPGGKGANQAVAAQRLGARTSLVGCIGTDAFGREVLSALVATGVDVAGVSTVAGGTGTALIMIDSAGDNVIGVSPGANGYLDAGHVDALTPMFGAADALLLQLEVPVQADIAAARLARAAGIPVVLNAAPLPAVVDGALWDLIALADLLVANETEAAGLAAAAGLPQTGAGSLARAATLRRLGPAQVVITLGAQGAVLATADGSPHWVPAFPVTAVDSVGAGDAFCAELAVARASGVDDLEAGVRRACAAGALAATRAGAQPASLTRASVDGLLATYAPSVDVAPTGRTEHHHAP